MSTHSTDDFIEKGITRIGFFRIAHSIERLAYHELNMWDGSEID
jgi:hypothetical protein